MIWRRRGATNRSPLSIAKLQEIILLHDQIVRVQPKPKPDVSRANFPASIGLIPLRLQVGYFIQVDRLEWPARPTPTAAHRADSHVLQKVIDNLRPAVRKRSYM
jgi:hypothetical protein